MNSIFFIIQAYICWWFGDLGQSPPPLLEGDEQKLEPSKLKKDPIDALDNLDKQTNNYVEADKHEKQQTMVLEATMLQGHDTPSNGQTQVPSIIYDEINLGVMI